MVVRYQERLLPVPSLSIPATTRVREHCVQQQREPRRQRGAQRAPRTLPRRRNTKESKRMQKIAEESKEK